jgi:Leishmanolysin
MLEQHEFTWDHWFTRQSDFDDIAFARVARGRADRSSQLTGTTDAGSYISGDPGVPDSNEYNLRINFAGSWAEDLQQAFISAAEAISDFIVGDIPDVGTRRYAVDDLMITASLRTIDGTGGILGQAGPTWLRVGSFLPSRGNMQFDAADADAYQAAGLFDDVVLHEMLHNVGFGTIWNDLGLITGGEYHGSLANSVYGAAGPIPLETDGDVGTTYSHWDEETFGSELMTGYVEDDNDLSYMTIASLGDLGYSTVSGASFAPPGFV